MYLQMVIIILFNRMPQEHSMITTGSKERQIEDYECDKNELVVLL